MRESWTGLAFSLPNVSTLKGGPFLVGDNFWEKQDLSPNDHLIGLQAKQRITCII